jgi:hypothetical protein
MIVAVVDRQIRNRAVGCEIVAAADMPVPAGVGEARSGDLDPDLEVVFVRTPKSPSDHWLPRSFWMMTA